MNKRSALALQRSGTYVLESKGRACLVAGSCRVLTGTLLSVALLSLPTLSYADYRNIDASGSSRMEPIHAERIVCFLQGGQGWKVGTATILNDRTILTAHHVVKGCSIVYIGKKSFKVTHKDPSIDLAVLGAGRDFRQLNCRAIPKGRSVSLTGFPEGSKQKVVSQGVTARDKKSKFAAVEGFAMKGMSGGPVIQADERLAGIFKAFRGTSRYWYVPGTKICNSLKGLKGARLNDGLYVAPAPVVEPLLVAENMETTSVRDTKTLQSDNSLTVAPVRSGDVNMNSKSSERQIAKTLLVSAEPRKISQPIAAVETMDQGGVLTKKPQAYTLASLQVSEPKPIVVSHSKNLKNRMMQNQTPGITRASGSNIPQLQKKATTKPEYQAKAKQVAMLNAGQKSDINTYSLREKTVHPRKKPVVELADVTAVEEAPFLHDNETISRQPEVLSKPVKQDNSVVASITLYGELDKTVVASLSEDIYMPAPKKKPNSKEMVVTDVQLSPVLARKVHPEIARWGGLSQVSVYMGQLTLALLLGYLLGCCSMLWGRRLNMGRASKAKEFVETLP